MLTPAEATQLIADHLPGLPPESLQVSDCAGAVLREDVRAERDQPPFDRVSMDGIALSSRAFIDGRRRFRIAGLQAAGDPPRALQSAGDCLEAMTGAVLPIGCDAVVPVERIVVEEGFATIAADVAVEPWLNVHRRGSDQTQGALLLKAGVRLESPDISVAAGAGMPRLSVTRQPTVMVVSTGNELVEPGEPIEAWQLRRSNAHGLVAALRRRGFRRVADDHLPDDPDALRERLGRHLQAYDVLLLSGGVSMGKLDLVPAALAACGVRQVFHKIAQRPGKPMWFGTTPNGRLVFALPGNPVSTLVCLVRYVIPALEASMGLREADRNRDRIALAAPVAFNAALAGFVPVRIETDDEGRPWAAASPHNGSGDFAALAGTDGFIELPPGPGVYPKGFVTRLYRW